MPVRYLGTTGLRVSEICMGCMNFGDGADEFTAHEMLDQYVAAGGNFIDTADAYKGGESEAILGRWLVKQDREKLVIATKVYFGGPGPNDMGLSRSHIMTNVAKSLSRLQTDYIDLYQIHNWDANTKVEDWLGTMKDLVTSGKIRMLGVCNVTGWQLQKIVMTAKAIGVPMVALQTQYSLMCREPEFELLDCAINEELGWLCWSPLKGGWLTGKFTKATTPDANSRVGLVESSQRAKMQSAPSYSQYADDDKVWSLLEAMDRIASKAGKTVPQVALRWCLQRKGVTSVIIGARTPAQLADNLGAVGWTLDDADMAVLCDKSAPAVPYPYEMVWRCSTKGDRFDGTMFPIKN
jgi:aryl-alcohol dehydrogenase-like predicted oxidoreductase